MQILGREGPALKVKTEKGRESCNIERVETWYSELHIR